MRPVPGAEDEPPVTLGETGELTITMSAARQYAAALARFRPPRQLRIDEAVRELEDVLAGAHRLRQPLDSGLEAWRVRDPALRVDIQAHVERRSRGLVVTAAHVKYYVPRPGSRKRRGR